MELKKIPGNENCADCNHPNPTQAVYNLGILVCDGCALIHRTLGPHISKVKTLDLDNWEPSLIENMKKMGNKQAKLKYEENVPPAYRRPTYSNPSVLKEQWIRAKYERKEFIGRTSPSYLSGYKEGILWKKGRDDNQFKQRKFVLDTSENTLKYYRKEDDKEPKALMRIDDFNLTLVPSKVGHPNAVQLTYEQNEMNRNLYLYADDGQDLVEWYTAMRAAKLNRLKLAFPNESLQELSKKIMWDYIKEGWLSKTGPRPTDVFRRRWFSLNSRTLSYFEDSISPVPKGEIFLGKEGYDVFKGILANTLAKEDETTFVVLTPERSFQLMADSATEAKEWIAAIKQVI